MAGRVVQASVWATLAALIVWILGSLLHLHLPWWYLAGLGAIALLALFRPLEGLQAVAALAPIAGVSVQLTTSVGFRAAEAVVLAALAGLAARRLWRPAPATPLRLRLPATLFAAAVVASLAVEMAGLQIGRSEARPFLASLVAWLNHEYFMDLTSFRSIQQAAVLLEGVALCCAVAAASRADPVAARRLRLFLVLGIAGAALLNLSRVAQAVGASAEPVARLHDILVRGRINVHFGDPNAAGSQFALALLLSAGLATRPGWISRAWLIATAGLAAALFLTHSLSAEVAAALAIVGWLLVLWLRRRAWTARSPAWLLAGAAVFAVTLAAAAYYARGSFPEDTRRAIHIRADLARVAWTMVAQAPVFGIGIGRFYPESSEYFTPLLREYYTAENAHNNLLQVAAELGVVGLIAFLWLMWAALGPAMTQVQKRTAEEIAALAAIGAFTVTMLAGHPLLIPEVAFGFWMALGAIVPDAGTPASARRVSRLMVAVALVVLGSAVYRAPLKRAQMDLEHVVIGFDRWQTGSDGERYRLVAREGAFFAASDPGVPTITEIALRADDRPALVTFSMGDRPGNAMRIRADGWQVIRLRMPPRAGGFRRVTLQTDAPVRVGVIRSRGPAGS